MCPDSASRRDLSAYLQRVTFYCHQLSITSRVKAGVHMLSDEIVSHLDDYLYYEYICY